MEKQPLPCPISSLMAVNFDGLKNVIQFLYDNIISLNEKTADINQKVSSLEETNNNFETKINIFENNISKIDDKLKEIENNSDGKKNVESPSSNVISDKKNDFQGNMDKDIKENLSMFEKKLNELNNKVNHLSKKISKSNNEEGNNDEDSFIKKKNNFYYNNKDKSQYPLDKYIPTFEKRINNLESLVKKIIETDKEKYGNIENLLNFDNNLNTEKNNDENKEITKEITNKTNEEQILENQKFSSDKKTKNQLNDLLNDMKTNPFLKQKDFIQYSNQMDTQISTLSNEIENLKSILENQNKINNDLKEKQNANNEFGSEVNKDTVKLMTMDIMNDIEKKNHDSIINYVSHLDLSTNPSLVEISTKAQNNKNSIKNINEKLKEIEENLEKFLKNGSGALSNEEIEKLKQQNLSFGRDLKDKSEKITFLQKKINGINKIIYGSENNDLDDDDSDLGPSLKEEMKIHNSYLKKLSEGINKVNNRIDNLNKETLAMIKRDLKNDSSLVLEEFKNNLKTSLSKIQYELKEKVDKLGLDEFRNQMNNQILAEVKGKIDKKDMERNNLVISKKIDTLEGRISRTLVDTLIDLQMDENPLIVKKSYKDYGVQKCAACNQNLPNRGVMNFNLGGSFNFDTISMGVMNTVGNVNSRRLNKQRTFASVEKRGSEAKLPDIKPSGHNN